MLLKWVCIDRSVRSGGDSACFIARALSTAPSALRRYSKRRRVYEMIAIDFHLQPVCGDARGVQQLDHSGGNAKSNAARRDVLHDHAARADDRVITDLNARQDGDIRADPYALADNHWSKMRRHFLVVVMLRGRDQAARSELGFLADVDGPVAEETAEAIDGSAIANGDASLGAGSDINGILKQAILTDADICRIDDLRLRPDDRTLAYAPLDVPVFEGRQANTEQTNQLGWVGFDDAQNVREFLLSVHPPFPLCHAGDGGSPGESRSKRGKEHLPSRLEKPLFIGVVQSK